MRQRFYKIIVVCFLGFASRAAYGQAQPKMKVIEPGNFVFVKKHSTLSAPMDKQLNRQDVILTKNSILKLRPLTFPANFYTQQFGFVCKKELQMQKSTRIPLFFRLGSVSYCNYLEAK